MDRRAYLGACAGAGMVGLSGCLGAVADSVTRTASTPAYLVPPVRSDGDSDPDGWRPRETTFVRPVDAEIDSGNPVLGTVGVRGWLSGSQLRVRNHNASRSNRSQGVRDDDADADGIDDGTESTGGTRATDYNSSRSNTEGIRDEGDDVADDDADADGLGDGTAETRANNHNTTRSNRLTPVSGEGDGSDEGVDLDAAFAYLEGEAVIGETFVVTAPAVDLPGVDDPSARTGHADYVKNMVTGARAASPSSEESVLRGLTTPTVVCPRCRAIHEMDKASPLFITSTPDDDDTPLAGEWTATSLPGRGDASAEHLPVVGRAVATLEGDVTLPVLVWAQHLVHGGDHVFVAGWVVDDARLYTNAATMLVAADRTRVLALSPEQVGDPKSITVEDLVIDEREMRGSLVYDTGGPASLTDAPLDLLCGSADCATGEYSYETRVRAALRPDDGAAPVGADEPVTVLAVPMDAPLVHLSGAVAAADGTIDAIVHTDSWEA